MGKESYRDVKPTEQGPNVISRSRGSGARRKRRAETQTLQEIPSDLVEGGFRRTASDSTPLDGMPLALVVLYRESEEASHEGSSITRG